MSCSNSATLCCSRNNTSLSKAAIEILMCEEVVKREQNFISYQSVRKR